MTEDRAQAISLAALGWIAASDDLMPIFLGASGASIDDVRTQAGDPTFLGAVLDFLMMDDSWIKAFCDDTGHPYDAPMQARQMLPGGDLPHWT